MRQGLVALHKPEGKTSFEALRPIKKRVQAKKVGHAGTLDRFIDATAVSQCSDLFFSTFQGIDGRVGTQLFCESCAELLGFRDDDPRSAVSRVDDPAQSDGAGGSGLGLLGAALATGLSALGAGIGVGMVGSSAMGALAEKPDMLGRVLILVGLAEGIAIYGLIVSILILNRLG